MRFDGQPTLVGELVRVRPLRPDDHSALYAVAADPAIWVQHPVRERHQAATFKAFFEESLASGGALLVLDKTNGAVIGSSRYFGYDAAQREVEIGWTFLATAYWGGRYNADLKEIMLRHAFRFVDSVVFYVGPENHRSQRSLEKVGAVRAEMPDQGRIVYRVRAPDRHETGPI